MHASTCVDYAVLRKYNIHSLIDVPSVQRTYTQAQNKTYMPSLSPLSRTSGWQAGGAAFCDRPHAGRTSATAADSTFSNKSVIHVYSGAAWRRARTNTYTYTRTRHARSIAIIFAQCPRRDRLSHTRTHARTRRHSDTIAASQRA